MKLYDIHIKYENGDEYSKYGLKEKDLKFHTIHSIEFDMASTTPIKEFKILQEIFGEDKLPIKNISRMDKIVDN